MISEIGNCSSSHEQDRADELHHPTKAFHPAEFLLILIEIIIFFSFNLSRPPA